MNKERVVARLTKYSRRDGDCIRWTGRLNVKGYGQIGVDGKSRAAHRVAYEVLVGPIPAGLEIDHLCRVRDCINVQHLEPVTHLENVRRRRDNPDECVKGHPFNEENTYWFNQKGRSNPVRKCRRCRKESNAARPRRPMTDQDKERLAARDRRGRKRARPARPIPDPDQGLWLTREGA
jgi:hypothetical protein